jgi:DNA-binding transcriptional MerR regulator
MNAKSPPDPALTPISKLSARLGVTNRALRHYETLGLVVPTRPEGHGRAYDSLAIQRLEVVVALRAADLPLRVVAEILDDKADPSAWQDRTMRLIETALGQARKTVDRLEAARRAARGEGLSGLRRLAGDGEHAASR